jgi:hypothetical protein
MPAAIASDLNILTFIHNKRNPTTNSSEDEQTCRPSESGTSCSHFHLIIAFTETNSAGKVDLLNNKSVFG